MSTTKKAAQLALVDVCVLLGEELGVTVELLLPQSPSALAQLLGSGEAELGWVSPTLLLMAPQLAETVPLLSAVRSGRAFFHSVVFAAAGTVKRVEDMKNLRAAWVAPTSAAGYLVPCLALSRRGIDLSRVLAGERFYGTHGAVAQAVVQGRPTSAQPTRTTSPATPKERSRTRAFSMCSNRRRRPSSPWRGRSLQT